jgi:hypothetical protein
VVRLKLLSLSPPDRKYPANTLAVAAVEFSFDSGETFIISDWRIVKNANVGPDWVAPPTRWTMPDATGRTKAVPIFISSRKTLHQVEDLILAEYEKQQTGRLDSDADDGSAGSSASPVAGGTI